MKYIANNGINAKDQGTLARRKATYFINDFIKEISHIILVSNYTERKDFVNLASHL